MDDIGKTIIIKNSFKKRLKTFIELGIIALTLPIFFPLFLIILFPHPLRPDHIIAYFFTIILMWSIGIPTFINSYKSNPVREVKFLINDEKIEMHLQKYLFYQFFWTNVERIEIINELFHSLFSNQIGIKLKIYSNNVGVKEIRLYILRFREDNIKTLLLNLELFSKRAGKSYDVIGTRIYYPYKEIKEDILNMKEFVCNLKSNAK